MKTMTKLFQQAERAKKGAVGLAIFIWLFVSSHGSCTVSGSWELYFDSVRLTDAASPIYVGPNVLVNITNLGTLLGMTVVPCPTGYEIRSTDGRRWRYNPPDAFLASDSHIVYCSVPPIQQGISLFLPVETVAQLAGLAVDIDSIGKKIVFRKLDRVIDTTIAQVTLEDGWHVFTIPKPTVKVVEHEPVTPSSVSTKINLPSDKEKLNVRMGVGYVQSVDWGFELGASGKVGGGQLDFLAWLTEWEGSTRLKNSRLSWINRDRGIGFEIGDMYAETWGLVRGAKYTWNAGDDTWPSIGVYAKTDKTKNTECLVALSDSLSIGKNLKLRGEVGSDESLYSNMVCQLGDLEIMGFLRHLPDKQGESKGVYVSLPFFERGSLFYGKSYSRDVDQRLNKYEVIGVHFPITRTWDLMFQQAEYRGEDVSNTMRSVGLAIPVTPRMRFLIRYQENSSEVDFLSGKLVNLDTRANSLLTSLSLFANERLYLDYQLNRYSQGGRTTSYEQLVANYRLGPKTSFQIVSGFPNITSSDLLRLRINHEITDGLSLLVDYGRLSPYQSSEDLFGKRGFSIMLRKTWPLAVPAMGATVSGVVLDQLGHPVEKVAVGLGNYVALTDKDGRYEFKYVPAGSYRIRILEESIPADYKATSSTEELVVKGCRRYQANFILTPLGCISGCVFIDRNENGSYDRGEGVPNIAVCANERATATDKEGMFSFYNLEPGIYLIRIASEVLNSRYVVVGPDRLEAELKPRESISDVKFQIAEKKRPIIFVPVDE
jgi:hypothetical protein